MNTMRSSRIIGAMLAMAIACGATYAQTGVNAPANTSAQGAQVTASANRSRADSALVRDVRRALTRTPGLNSSGIHVVARNGVVTLTGWVPQRSQITRAGNAARSVRGVRSVSNRLTLRTARGSGR